MIDVVEAEKPAFDTQQKGEAAGDANSVKEENNILLEAEKATALPTYDTSTIKEPKLENSQHDKTGYFHHFFLGYRKLASLLLYLLM